MLYARIRGPSSMPESLQDLESRRAELAKQFARLGDLRSGSLSNTSGRCGKPNCRCHQPDQPAHGPNARLTYKVQGKTVTESLPSPAAQKRPHARLLSFATSNNWSGTSWGSMQRSASADRHGISRGPRNKNDGGGLRKGDQPVNPSVPTNLRRPAYERPSGSGGGGDGHSLHRTPDRSGGGHRTVTLSATG